ncbi:MaoC family dehydratase [Pseudooceanicola pacificus]|nr:MaoC family dehydratase [Pseudooceanicola pacificus]
MAVAAQDFVAPFAGMEFAPRRFRLNAADEARMMRVCGSDPALFDHCIDPAALIPHAIRESVLNGLNANGMVNMLQRIEMQAPLRLDEEITVTGRVTEVIETARGPVNTTETFYHGQDGRPGFALRRVALMTDPDRKADPSLRGAGERPAPVVPDPAALRQVGRVTLTPADVKTYCLDTGNLIHVDPVVAANAGYRAPLIGGSHGVRYMTAAIWREGAPRSIVLDIRFRRPIFWDEGFDVRVADGDPRWSAICLARGPKVLAEIAISGWA